MDMCRRKNSVQSNKIALFGGYCELCSITVLEGNPPPGDDDFELWDQSQMWRSEHKKWQNNTWCKPSCIPITVIFFLIVLVVLLPLVEQANDKILHTKHNGSQYLCTDSCNIQIVESIPIGLNYSDDSPKYLSTYDAWMKLLKLANSTINIGSFYWTLRGTDFYNHSTAWQGEKIFQQLLIGGTQRNLQIRIAQSAPTKENPNQDTEFLARRNAAEVRSVNFPRLVGGGVLHTKLWVIDEQHFYLGSANMDWRSLTQVKELGVLVTNCTCLAKDVNKIFNAYWYLGKNNSHIPSYWPDEYSTKFNMNNMLKVNFNRAYDFRVFFSSSPPPLSPRGRTQDLDAIINTILHAEKFVYIAVMDYFPLTIYTPKHKYWPYIDNAIRTAAIENKVAVKMLVSWWKHSRPEEDNYLRSLESLADSKNNIDIQIKRFIVRSTPDQDKIPYARVNHNKYMVTDNTGYIGTSNWSGDYFTDTAGIGLILRETDYDRLQNETTIRSQLENIFLRDWDSEYAVDLSTINVH
ncbi:5'-3' exonuclease PLD3-like isoform X2 [Condylostylus longicornis]|uniref:5'-3' exonuclease PLD3-like isoform X2 n=1 Tax=Condylostylus longicornis TaxID=2530218 RepID=UPI00244E170F|nr:5'-3' exonuclease PLD3-like isoform X2 [Condylostylus longicornis]